MEGETPTSLAVCLPPDLGLSEPLASSVNWACPWPLRALERIKWGYIEEKRPLFSPPPQMTPGEVSVTPKYCLLCPKPQGQRRDWLSRGQSLAPDTQHLCSYSSFEMTLGGKYSYPLFVQKGKLSPFLLSGLESQGCRLGETPRHRPVEGQGSGRGRTDQSSPQSSTPGDTGPRLESQTPISVL